MALASMRPAPKDGKDGREVGGRLSQGHASMRPAPKDGKDAEAQSVPTQRLELQ